MIYICLASKGGCLRGNNIIIMQPKNHVITYFYIAHRFCGDGRGNNFTFMHCFGGIPYTWSWGRDKRSTSPIFVDYGPVDRAHLFNT